MARTALLAVGLLIAASHAELAAQGKIKWERNFQQALERAKKENKPIVACISMKGERVCDIIVSEHYKDSAIVQLSRHTINLFCSPHGDDAQKEMEKRVRLDLLKKDPFALMIAPQHVFFSPEGKVMISVPYYVAVGELEWMWQETLKRHDSSFEWEVSERMRAPRRLKLKKTATAKKIPKPPTRKELEKIIKDIKREWGGYHGAREKLPIIVRHEGKQARRFVQRILEALDTGDRNRVNVLRVIGANSPRVWSGVVLPFLAHETASVRIAAANTLGQLGEKKAVKALMNRWRKESDDSVKIALLGAMVACGPDDHRVVKLLPFVLKEHKSENIRVHAALASAGLEKRDAVQTSVQLALVDDAARVRATAAYAIASRRDEALLPALEAAAKTESDTDTKKWMTAACAVVRGGSMDSFEKFLGEVVGK